MSFQPYAAGGHRGQTRTSPQFDAPMRITHPGDATPVGDGPAVQVTGVFHGQPVTVRATGLPMARTPLLKPLDEHKAFTRSFSGHHRPDSTPAAPLTRTVRHLGHQDAAAAAVPSHAATQAAPPAKPARRGSTTLPNGRAQAFLLDHGLAKLTSTTSAAVRDDILRQVLRAAADTKAAGGAHRLEDITRALAQHLQAQQPPIPNWEDILLQALVQRHARSQDASTLVQFSAALRGLAAAVEPGRATASPAFHARVFACIMHCHTAAKPADRVPDLAVHHLVSEMIRHLCMPVREPRLSPDEFGQWSRQPRGSDRPPRSPHEMGQVVKELARSLKGSRLEQAVLSTLVHTITRMQANLSWQQLVAMGCGYVLGQAGPAAHGAAWDRLTAQVKGLIKAQTREDGLPEDFVFGLKAALDPVAAWDQAHTGFAPQSRIDVILIAMELGRDPNPSTQGALIARLAAAEPVCAREAALRAEAMVAVLEANPAQPLALPHLKQATLFTGHWLRWLVNAFPGVSRVADCGCDATRLHRALGHMFDLAAQRMNASAADRAAFAKAWSTPLATWPERIAAPLLARLAALTPPLTAQPQSPQPTGD